VVRSVAIARRPRRSTPGRASWLCRSCWLVHSVDFTRDSERSDASFGSVPVAVVLSHTFRCGLPLDPPPHHDPVGRDLALRLHQAHRPRADLAMEEVLHLVLLVKARRGLGRFGPQVRDRVVAAQFEGDEVIDLVGARGSGYEMPYSRNACRWTSAETRRRSWVERWHTTFMSVVITAPGVQMGSGSDPRTVQPLSLVRDGGEWGPGSAFGSATIAAGSGLDDVLGAEAAGAGIGAGGVAGGGPEGVAPVQAKRRRASAIATTRILGTPRRYMHEGEAAPRVQAM
jgi:hypothetical protein